MFYSTASGVNFWLLPWGNENLLMSERLLVLIGPSESVLSYESVAFSHEKRIQIQPYRQHSDWLDWETADFRGLECVRSRGERLISIVLSGSNEVMWFVIIIPWETWNSTDQCTLFFAAWHSLLCEGVRTLFNFRTGQWTRYLTWQGFAGFWCVFWEYVWWGL